ncbi:hypothetical protein [Paenibacillus mesotrionivorans]|jgi:hypothetical protein|uniref:Uncharacterized protein n=1 Tax=Paenibacillus mesotrionivorans TaxID=3160968 RepID=A0ACC7NU53_9BACL
MLESLFRECLSLSSKLRPNYSESLGTRAENWEETFGRSGNEIPLFFKSIYNHVSGTRRDINQQELMDFIPGYRLIHITEITKEKENVKNILVEDYLNESDNIIPFLTNYSSDFYCIIKNAVGEESICVLTNDSGEPIEYSRSPQKFFETIIEFYRSGVYFLDHDGYLDYDYEKQRSIGSEINKGVSYWVD